VVDLTRLLPGAYCTLVLADLGADVIKVEDPNGGDLMRTLPPQVDGLSVYHHALNRNKRSITLDLRAPEAGEVLDRLLAHADVVIESFRPRTARRLKVSADDLRARHPRLVHCSLTGFGQSGPYADRAAHDLNFVALAGLFEVDQPDSAGARPAVPRAPGPAVPVRDADDLHVPRLLVADIGGAWAAVAGILAALFQRERTGRGSAVDIAIYDVAASWLTFPAAPAAIARPTGAAERLPISGDAACYNVYLTADGRHVALAAIEQKFWQTFCARIGRPDFIPLQFAPGEQPRMRHLVATTFRSQTMAYWLTMFADADICLAPVRTIGDALADPQLAHRGAVAAAGKSRFIRTPVVFASKAEGGGREAGHLDRTPIAAARPLGSDTDDVLRSAGLDDSELASLRSRGVI
jgi:crotonobetainyl-CoA:carnitine CoA-transferase CaiB-like acyl-CoA transferase